MLAPYNDTERWKVKQAAEITGYVFDVKVGVIESTNCHASGVEQRDTHIELVLDPMAGSPTQRVIVEVTPRWRAIVGAQGVDWSTRTLRDRLLGHSHFGVSTRCDGSPDPDIVLNGVVGYQCFWKKTEHTRIGCSSLPTQDVVGSLWSCSGRAGEKGSYLVKAAKPGH